jgi:hypothetical protein
MAGFLTKTKTDAFPRIWRRNSIPPGKFAWGMTKGVIMAILSPSNLETCDIATSGWNAIYSANFQRINTYLGHPMSAASVPGVPTVDDPDTQTSETLTDSTGGTPGNEITAISGSGADAAINNALASLIDEVNKLRADVAELRAVEVALLEELRKSTGVGILGD